MLELFRILHRFPVLTHEVLERGNARAAIIWLRHLAAAPAKQLTASCVRACVCVCVCVCVWSRRIIHVHPCHTSCPSQEVKSSSSDTSASLLWSLKQYRSQSKLDTKTGLPPATLPEACQHIHRSGNPVTVTAAPFSGREPLRDRSGGSRAVPSDVRLSRRLRSKSADVDGSGDAVARRLRGKSADVDGSGDAVARRLQGKSADVNGSGDAVARRLQGKSADVDGSGDAVVRRLQGRSTDVNGSGDAVVRGRLSLPERQVEERNPTGKKRKRMSEEAIKLGALADSGTSGRAADDVDAALKIPEGIEAAVMEAPVLKGGDACDADVSCEDDQSAMLAAIARATEIAALGPSGGTEAEPPAGTPPPAGLPVSVASGAPSEPPGEAITGGRSIEIPDGARGGNDADAAGSTLLPPLPPPSSHAGDLLAGMPSSSTLASIPPLTLTRQTPSAQSTSPRAQLPAPTSPTPLAAIGRTGEQLGEGQSASVSEPNNRVDLVALYAAGDPEAVHLAMFGGEIKGVESLADIVRFVKKMAKTAAATAAMTPSPVLTSSQSDMGGTAEQQQEEGGGGIWRKQREELQGSDKSLPAAPQATSLDSALGLSLAAAYLRFRELRNERTGLYLPP